MAIKFEKIQPGMTLYQKVKRQAGNTTVRVESVFTVKILNVDAEKRSAEVSWNGNQPHTWYERNLTKLYAKKPEVKKPFWD
jgi:hypothetical protein